MSEGPKCVVIDQASKDRCGADATHVIGWPDGDKSPACEPCALKTQQLAASHGTRLSIEKIEVES